MTKKKAADGDTPVYRCELCGGVAFKVDSKITPGTLRLFTTNSDAVIKVGDVPRAIVHGCPNGGFGIARIVGIVPEEVMMASMTPMFDDDHECKGPVN